MLSSFSRHPFTGEFYSAHRRMREKYDRRRRRAAGSGHQAQGLDADVLATAVEIEEPAGPVLAQLIAADMPARWPWPLLRHPQPSASDPLKTFVADCTLPDSR